MKKSLIFLGAFTGLLLTLACVSGAFVSAKKGAVTSLADDQVVLVDQPVDGAKKIKGTRFYKTTVGAVKSAKIDSPTIYPTVEYQHMMTVDDPEEPQDYLTLLGAETFWDDATDASGIVVAVVDTGYALDHEDMVDRWFINDGEYGTTTVEGDAPNCTSRSLALDKSCNNLDDDENGFVDDWRGWDFANEDNEPLVGTTDPAAEGAEHGTEVSGLIGSNGNNTIGAASINWQSKIMPLQIFTDDGSATTLELAEAIAYAIDMNVDVINLSLGSVSSDSAIESLLIQAEDAGIVVVASIGNCGGDSWSYNGCLFEGQMTYPGNSDHAISVGATNMSDSQASFSSYGSKLDIMAPGSGNLVSTSYSESYPTDDYSSSLYGTSFATPIVSGIVAKLKAVWPEASVADIRAVLIDSAVKPTGMAGEYFDDNYGFGRVDPVAALARVQSCRATTHTADINCDGSVSLLDLSLLSSQWQMYYTGRSDINQSGQVDLLDLSNIASQWGQE